MRGKKERSLILTEGPIGDGGEDHWDGEDTEMSVDICWQERTWCAYGDWKSYLADGPVLLTGRRVRHSMHGLILVTDCFTIY